MISRDSKAASRSSRRRARFFKALPSATSFSTGPATSAAGQEKAAASFRADRSLAR